MIPTELEEDVRNLESALRRNYSLPHSRYTRNTPSRGNPRTRPIYRSPTDPEVIVEKRVIGEDGKVRILSPPYE